MTTQASAEAAAAGIAAITIALFGVSPHALVAASAGAGLGLLGATITGRFRATATFLAVMFGAAYVSTALAEAYFANSMAARNGTAFVLGAVAHFALSELLKQVGPIIAGWADKIGAKR